MPGKIEQEQIIPLLVGKKLRDCFSDERRILVQKDFDFVKAAQAGVSQHIRQRIHIRIRGTESG
jgi:hypothetical protein